MLVVSFLFCFACCSASNQDYGVLMNSLWFAMCFHFQCFLFYFEGSLFPLCLFTFPLPPCISPVCVQLSLPPMSLNVCSPALLMSCTFNWIMVCPQPFGLVHCVSGLIVDLRPPRLPVSLYYPNKHHARLPPPVFSAFGPKCQPLVFCHVTNRKQTAGCSLSYLRLDCKWPLLIQVTLGAQLPGTLHPSEVTKGKQILGEGLRFNSLQ